MYNQDELINILKESIGEKSLNEFARTSGVDSAYISRIINKIRTTPPSPKILEKIAQSSHGITTYEELMQICGYSEENIESVVYKIYQQLIELAKKIYKKKNNDLYEVESAIENFQEYIPDLLKSIEKKELSKIYLINYYRKDFLIEDYNLVCSFLFLYESFLKCLEKKLYITLIDYEYSNYFQIEEIYNNLSSFENLELLSFNSTFIKINYETSNKLLEYIKNFLKALNLAYLSDYNNNALTELFKKKIQNKNNNEATRQEWINENKYIATTNSDGSISYSEKFYMCPVYGQISAGQPNWAEECIDGRIPIDPNLMNIVNPEKHFFLRVNGESMNKIVKNGAYALIHKQDIVEDGEIAVVLVNGFDATLKKFSKQGDFIILEPMSDVVNDPDIKTQIYDQTTPIKILGKYVGKFEINK